MNWTPSSSLPAALREERETLVQADARRPFQDPAGPTLIEPVRRRELPGQEPGHRWIIGPAPKPPQPLSDSTSGPRDRTGHGASRGLHTARGTDPLEQLGNRAGLPVGDHEDLPVTHRGVVQGRHHRVHRVVDVGGVDQRPPAPYEGQPPGPGTIHDPLREDRRTSSAT